MIQKKILARAKIMKETLVKRIKFNQRKKHISKWSYLTKTSVCVVIFIHVEDNLSFCLFQSSLNTISIDPTVMQLLVSPVIKCLHWFWIDNTQIVNEVTLNTDVCIFMFKLKTPRWPLFFETAGFWFQSLILTKYS